MRKYLLIFLLLFMPVTSHAGLVEIFLWYEDATTVTDDNLNGNLQNIRSVINGGLDNTNANVEAGFRFVEIYNVLPAAGVEGRVIYEKTSNQLYWDDGTSWTISLIEDASGDVSITNNLTVGGDIFVTDITVDTITATGAVTIVDGSFTQDAITLSGAVSHSIMVTNGDTEISSVSPGVSGSIWSSGGTNSSGYWATPTGIPSNCTAYTSSGNWTRPAGINSVWVRVWGAGGGGGNGDNNTKYGSGGGGGGFGEGIIDVSSASHAVTVGSGGAGNQNAAGSNGGISSFTGDGSDYIRGAGGTGGAATGGAGGAGGSAAGCDICQDGADGISGGTGGIGEGGASFGSGYNVDYDTGAEDGVSGSIYGQGGSGGRISAPSKGGAGAAGLVVVCY